MRLSRGSLIGAIASLLVVVGAPAPARAPSSSSPRAGSCPIFPAGNPLNRDISHAPVDPNSARYIDSIGATGHLHADFGTPPSYGIP